LKKTTAAKPKASPKSIPSHNDLFNDLSKYVVAIEKSFFPSVAL
jgi:hypothetical protein